MENAEALEDFRRQLVQVRDLERTIGRLSVGSGNGRDLLALRMALEKQGKDASIAVIRFGGHVLPIVDDETSDRVATVTS